MSALRGFRRGQGRALWIVGATLVAAAAFGVIFVAASGAAPTPCPIPGGFEIDGDMIHATCSPPGGDWDNAAGVQATTQGGTYSTSGKDDGNPSTWSSSGSTPDKTNFAQAYAFSKVVNGHFFVYVAWERTSTSGTQGYAIEITNAGSNVAADGTPQPIRGTGGTVFYISSQGSSPPAFDQACSYTSQSNYGQTCTSSNASVTSAINTTSISDPLNNTTQPAGAFFEAALDVTTLTGIAPSCPGPSAASVYLRSITGQTHNGNLKGYMAPLNVAPDSTCVPPPITTTATPGGSTNLPGTAQHDQVTVNDGTNAGVGTVKFFLCSPSEVTANGGDCKANGTQVGGTATLDASGNGMSDIVDGSSTPNDNAPGTYCWRAEFTPGPNDHHYLPGSHTNSDSECFKILATPAIVTTPNPSSVTLGTSAVTLKDSAVLSSGSSPTGTITFTLVYKGSTVDTESVSVSGNGTYATPTGFTLPTSGTVTGTYQWNATYSGDSNNASVSENNDPSERVTVSPASPTVVTTASAPATLPGPVTFSDSAVLSGGYHPAGTLTFTLSGPSGFSYTQTDTVSGNGTYTASDGPIANPDAGTYTWTVSYSGDGNNNQATDQGGSAEQTVVSPASPSIVTTPNPSSVTLGTSAVTLKDSAVLSSGSSPTGTITFTLVYKGSTVDTETVPVSGNGTYTTPTGFTLPTSGTVIGTYQWNATYSGDKNNGSVSENNDPSEQVTVNPASPTVVTTASAPATLPGSVTFSDSAVVSGGYHPTGTLIFTLSGPNGFSYTQTDTVSGNGTYTASDGPIVNPDAGTYTWSVSYTGDGNNNSASDQGGSAEQTVVSPASPSIVTTPDPKSVTLGTGAVTLKDSAVLSDGSHPSGTITFTLVYKGSTVDTETVTVSGNGTYTTPTGFTLPSSGTVTGTYQWNATYSGDDNNNAVSENNDASEQVTVSPASPSIVTTPAPKAVTLDNSASPNLKDSAVLSGGYHPTGTITFTLVYKGSTVDTETATVSGNGTYSTPTGYTLPTSGTVTGTYQWNATYSGDSNNASVSENNDPSEQVTVNPASPTVVTTASGPVTLPASVTFSDSAVVAGGYHPAGTLTFTLSGPNGFSYTQTDTVSGNGTYTASDGPIANPDAGTYTWTVTYAGDGNNNEATDQGGPAEQTVVSNAGPKIVTTPSPTSVKLGSSLVTLNDSAVLSGGSAPTGTITFTLVYKGSTVDTETVTVSGNGTYSTPTGYTLPSSGTVTGTYQWNAAYSGDGNNDPASENNDPSEQVTVNPASPTVVTTASAPATLPGSVTFTDSAVVSGGYAPTGTLTFTLTGPNGFSYTQTDTVSGNGTYTAGDGPITNPDAGTYTWTVTYSGDGNNDQANDQGGSAEQTVISPASPSIVTTPDPKTVTLGTGTVTLNDSAVLAGGSHPSGTITFTLVYKGSTVDTETVTVSGNGTYTTPTGYTLPTSGTVSGTYQWNATYSGDDNNNSVSENNDESEQVTVNPASPSIVTTPDPSSATLGNGTITLNDSALLSGGYHPTGTITFTLVYKGSTVDTETASVSGNGTYTTPTGYTLPTSGTVTGTYQWNATYSGDDNNNSVSENNDESEQVTINPASPSIVTTPSETTGSVDDVLNDTAHLSDGTQFDGSGTITFNLYGPSDPNCSGTPAYTEKVTADHNGDYTTSNSSVAADTAGTWNWTATFSGDPNNKQAVSGCGAEQVVIGEAVIHILKTADHTQVSAGDQIGFTMTVWNDGAGDAKGVTLDDILPTNPGLDWTIADQGAGWGGSCAIAAGELTCGSVTVPAGTDKDTSTFTVHIVSVTDKTTGGDCEETAGVVDNTGDVSTTNDGSDQSSASICVAAPVIHILKTPDNAQVDAGDPIGFTMTVWNSGNGDAKNVTLTDTLPTNPGLDWKIADQGDGWNSTCEINAGELTCGPVTVPAGTDQEPSTFTVHITSTTDKTTGGDCEETGVVHNTGDVTTANDGSDQSSASTCVEAPAIHILKTADNARVAAGDPIGFTMTVWNTGNGAAKNATLTDQLPTSPGLSWTIDKQGAGWGGSCKIAAGALTCGPVTVPTGTTQANSTFTVHIVSTTTGATGGDCPTSGLVDNTGKVATSNDGSDQSSASTCVQAMVDLSITKTGSPASQTLGDGNITWTIVVTNNGPSEDTGVTITDPMPTGNTFVSATTTKGSCTGGAALTCDIGPMAAGEKVTIILVTTPTAAGTQTNVASVSGNRPETNTGNNKATATVEVGPFTPPVFCVAVSRVTPKQLFVGRKTMLTIHVTKQGKAIKGIHVRIKGPKLNKKTKASNGKGVIKQTVKMKKAGVLIFTPIASKRCNTKRVGITNVFTPPVTG